MLQATRQTRQEALLSATVKDGKITCDLCRYTVASTDYRVMDRHMEMAHSNTTVYNQKRHATRR